MSASSSQALEVTRERMLSEKPPLPLGAFFLFNSVRDRFMAASLQAQWSLMFNLL